MDVVEGVSNTNFVIDAKTLPPLKTASSRDFVKLNCRKLGICTLHTIIDLDRPIGKGNWNAY
jgi:hypothetical protein